MKYKYTAVPTNDPKAPWLRQPLIEVKIFGETQSADILGLIDSGADICLFHIDIAKGLGIDLTNAEVQRVSGIDGTPQEMRMAWVPIQVERQDRIVVRAGFIDSPGVRILLGQNGFFDCYKIRFHRAKGFFEISTDADEIKKNKNMQKIHTGN